MAIAKVHVASWQIAYRDIFPAEYLATLSVEQRKAQWTDTIGKAISQTFVAEINGEIVGFSCVGPCRDEGAQPTDFEIWALYVIADYWKQGVGRELWLTSRSGALAKGARRISLWAVAGNVRAINFYQRAGFACEEASLTSFELGGVEAQEFRFSQNLA